MFFGAFAPAVTCNITRDQGSEDTCCITKKIVLMAIILQKIKFLGNKTSHFKYRGFHEKGTLSYLVAQGWIDSRH